MESLLFVRAIAYAEETAVVAAEDSGGSKST